MSQKTMGQIAFEAWTSDPSAPQARRWILAANAILEEAAKIADITDPNAHDIAARIRAMKST